MALGQTWKHNAPRGRSNTKIGSRPGVHKAIRFSFPSYRSKLSPDALGRWKAAACRPQHLLWAPPKTPARLV